MRTPGVGEAGIPCAGEELGRYSRMVLSLVVSNHLLGSVHEENRGWSLGALGLYRLRRSVTLEATFSRPSGQVRWLDTRLEPPQLRP